METIVFSQASLLAFVACRRRFQLRYLDKVPWPDHPFSPSQRTAIETGQAFHQLLERFFLGLPINESTLADGQLQTWWRRFKENVLPLPPGKAIPELRLSVPVGAHFLIGRFDLVNIEGEAARPCIHIYDWKSSQPKTAAELEDEWQTKLYLAIAAESGRSLVQEGAEIHPERIRLTYWYATDPAAPRTIVYSADRHRQNWAELEGLIAAIETCFAANEWPLTDHWGHCRACTYATYCGRYETGSAPSLIAEDEVAYEFDPIAFIEPESP